MGVVAGRVVAFHGPVVGRGLGRDSSVGPHFLRGGNEVKGCGGICIGIKGIFEGMFVLIGFECGKKGI